MSDSSARRYPPFWTRIYSVWYRHMRVYTRNLISNGLPPFLEPLIFLAGIGLGLGTYIEEMAGIPYLQFLATGLLVTTAMYTAAFECSFGTFIRLEFDKVYDGMLGASLCVQDLILGEIIWAGSKGFFFSFAVLIVVSAFGVLPSWGIIAAPLVGFLTGIMFGTVSLWITSYVKNINHFNFYFTGFLSPMFFFSGVVFPIENLPDFIEPFAEIFPLTHSVRLMRAFSFGQWEAGLAWDVLYAVLFIAVTGFFAMRRLRRRLVC